MFLLLTLLACPAPDATPVDSGATDSGGTDTADSGADTADTGADTADSGDTADTADTAASDDADGDGVLVDEDCDDHNPTAYPGAPETCDGVDQDCDTLIDEGAASVAYVSFLIAGGAPTTGGAWYGYDAEDNLVLVGTDADADGVLESYQRYEWTDGLQTAEEQSNDGVHPSYRVEYTRNAFGAITDAQMDTDGDGDWDFAYGYWYEGEVYAGYWSDTGADGVYETEQRTEFDADGNPEHSWSDDDGDGQPEQEVWYTYVDGKLISYSADNDGDGTAETQGAYTYDGDRLVEENVTGGSYPSRRTYTYTDADDHYDIIDYDLYNDGVVDYRYTYSWDGDLVVAQSYDQWGDGVEVSSYAYTYDDEGRTLTASSALDGTFTNFTEYEWQESGIAAYRYDLNADGVWDAVTLYNARGAPWYESADAAGDGTLDYIRTTDVDARTRRIGATLDNLGDGVLETQQAALDGYACGAM